MNTKEIYLAGGCYWGVEAYISGLKGVMSTTVGFANGSTVSPTYKQVCTENTGHAETVKVIYDPEVITLRALLRLFYKIIEPTSVDRQGEDVGHQYRTGVYYTDPADADTVRETLEELEASVGEKIAVEGCPLENFYDAEEYHQKYLVKNPGGYCHVQPGLIGWAKTVDPAEYA